MTTLIRIDETSVAAIQEKSVHHDFIKNAMPEWVRQTSPRRISALKSAIAPLPEWILCASPMQRAALQRASEESWRAQNDVDQMLSEAQDVYAFAEPLLRQALKDQYGVDVDVKETFLQLFSPPHLSPWANNFNNGVESRIVSMLDAALHNFSDKEVLTSDSQFITRPDKSNRFDITGIRNNMSIDQFKTLCRSLDIGAQYKVHLEGYVRPVDGLARGVVQQKVMKSQKAALKAALYLASLKNDISASGYLAVQSLLKDIKEWKMDGLPVHYYQLKMLDVQLRGIVLIAPDLHIHDGAARRVIAYVPHDPEHPLKEYASKAEFARELTRQLRDAPKDSANSYQQFFSRFVDHQQRGRFFAALNAALVQITQHDKVPGVDQPVWRETPIENPRLHFDHIRFENDTHTFFTGDPWLYLYQQQQNKILNDAREMVISTQDADRMERWAWFDNLEKMLSDIFNAALMVVGPLIPFVGEIMMGYMVYQLVNEVVEGIVDLAEGLYLEGAEHIIGFFESVIQLAAFAGGIKIGKEVVLPKLSSFIESTTPVTLSSGAKRLWSGDLEPYQKKNLTLAADSKPDETWLHRHEGKPILKLDTRHFELTKDPQTGKHRVKHPTRPDAFQPVVDSNGAGAFVIEGEQPHTWDHTTLMARLGPDMGELAESYGDIRTVSQTDASAIRRMYADNERPLPLLSDTVTRFRIDRDIQAFIEQVGSERVQDYSSADPEMQFQLLDGLWPGNAIELVNARGEVLRVIGSAGGSRVRINSNRLADVDLLKTLLSHLDDAQLNTLLNVEFRIAPSTLEMNAKNLRAELAKLAESKRTSLFNARYRRIEAATSDSAKTIQAKVPGLPGTVARELLSIATPSEVQAIERGQLPARLENLARWALRDVRMSRAYEGFYLDSVESPDLDRLALHSLEHLRGWNPDVRIEVRRFEYDGHLLDSIGKDDAGIRRTLVELHDSTFVAYNADGNALHSGMDLFSAILQALPDAERNALNIHIGQGPTLKLALRDNALKPFQLLKVLDGLPVLDPLTYDPRLMRLRGGAPGAGGERVALEEVGGQYSDLVTLAFHPSVSEFKQFDYLRGLKLIYDRFPHDYFFDLYEALNAANATGEAGPGLEIVQSIEALPDLQKLMLPEQFNALTGRLFTEEGLVPLTESERNLGVNARNLEQTGRANEYQALLRSVRENRVTPSPELTDLSEYGEVLSADVATPGEPIQVSAQTMANLKMAQEAIYRAKELLPLSSNQLPSMWEKGGSAIAKIKGLRGMDLEEGGFSAKLTIAEAARKAIDIKGGNCSENSKVTFSILASQPRTSSIHIVKVTDFDHQYVVMGDDLNNLNGLVVADSWPEFPAAHLASKGYFQFDRSPLMTLRPGPAVAEYNFINEAPPGPATLPAVSEANTYRQIKIDKLYKKEAAAFAQWTSLSELGQTYAVEGGTPVSFERMPASVIDNRVDAYHRYREAFKDLLAAEAD
ncbi:dermonecrotic toxin domain-containing protein [Pseudomonas sp. NPDC099000]|uniref:dermonecrotic toxin domain-containing protein n=1 Tax=Pseudomonas sp. NPDC099000 TaxID=3364488 RepID=UPI00383AF341